MSGGKLKIDGPHANSNLLGIVSHRDNEWWVQLGIRHKSFEMGCHVASGARIKVPSVGKVTIYGGCAQHSGRKQLNSANWSSSLSCNLGGRLDGSKNTTVTILGAFVTIRLNMPFLMIIMTYNILGVGECRSRERSLRNTLKWFLLKFVNSKQGTCAFDVSLFNIIDKSHGVFL